MEEMDKVEGGTRKKLLGSMLFAGIVIIILSSAIWLGKNDVNNIVVPAPPVTEDKPLPPQIYTEADKRQMLEDYAKSNTTTASTEAEKRQMLVNFNKQPQAQPSSGEAKRLMLESFYKQTE